MKANEALRIAKDAQVKASELLDKETNEQLALIYEAVKKSAEQGQLAVSIQFPRHLTESINLRLTSHGYSIRNTSFESNNQGIDSWGATVGEKKLFTREVVSWED